jgi:hypothetical protein
LIARDNDTRRGLNARARALVRQQGMLGVECSYGPVQIAVGDRVICRRNDRTVDVDNGTRGTVRAVALDRIELETDAGALRRVPAAYVSAHVEHAYALTGHGMQGGTVECAFVVAAPHELTKGWSYTALSRARGGTHLFVATDQNQLEREELAPGERQERLTKTELYARLQRYMKTRDDEDLAIEQLRSAGRREVALKGDVGSSVQHDAPLERAEPPTKNSSILAAYQHAREQTAALKMQLQALSGGEVKRLEAAERRERSLIAHEYELTARMQLIRPAPRWSFARDCHMTERQHLEQAIEAARLELDGVRSIRDRLVQEVGQPDQIRAERVELERMRSCYEREQHRLLHQLVAHELTSDPGWVKSALGQRPPARPEGELWDRAARGLARYRLEQGIVDERNALGNRPSTIEAIERYEQVRATLEDVQRRLGIAAREGSDVEPIRLPRQYLGLLGDARAAELEAALSVEAKRVRDLPDDELRTLARVQHQVLAGLDRAAAGQALRLEREHGHHQETAQKQTERATELESQASALGWRARHDRDDLRHAATLQRDNAARHLADAERLELEMSRLVASGRHPDQWLHGNSQRLVTGLVAEAELEHRRQRDIAHHVELAITDPPEHVQELIGKRPVSGVTLARQWERLAESIERHRLGYVVDVGRDGALGPEPDLIPREQRDAYTEQRERLASDVAQYRRMVKLMPHDRSCEITREAALDHALEHELR